MADVTGWVGARILRVANVTGWIGAVQHPRIVDQRLNLKHGREIFRQFVKLFSAASPEVELDGDRVIRCCEVGGERLIERYYVTSRVRKQLGGFVPNTTSRPRHQNRSHEMAIIAEQMVLSGLPVKKVVQKFVRNGEAEKGTQGSQRWR